MSENPFDGVTRVLHIRDTKAVNELLSIKPKPPFPRIFRIIAVAKHLYGGGDEELVYSVGQFGDIPCPRHEPSHELFDDQDQVPNLTVKIQSVDRGFERVCFECPECGPIPIEEIKRRRL